MVFAETALSGQGLAEMQAQIRDGNAMRKDLFNTPLIVIPASSIFQVA